MTDVAVDPAVGTRVDGRGPALPVARGTTAPQDRPVSRVRLLLRVFLMALGVAAVVMLAGGLAARSLAQTEAVRDAAVRTDQLALDVAQPVMGDGLTRMRPADVARLDRRVRESMTGRGVARVKVWRSDGTIVYSDEPRLIGARFALGDEEREAFETGETEAETSELDGAENRFERGHGPLLEVYRSVRTPDGTPLLFEVYYRYEDVLTSATSIGLGFVVVTGVSLLLFLLALLPLLHRLVRTVERAREQRELLLLKALDASDAERRRIAAALHDGPVQDLVGASYRLGATASGVRNGAAADSLAEAERAVRGTIEGLRDALVDLYPAALTEEGVAAVVADLATGARARGAVVVVRIDPALRLPADAERLVFRVVRETLANAVKHADGAVIRIGLQQVDGRPELVVEDDGPGFDAAGLLASPPEGHFGLRLLRDAVAESGVGAELTVASRTGAGTRWRLVLEP